MRGIDELFREYYDSHNLENNSQYSDCSKEQLVTEAEYMNACLHRVLKYINDGGTDINRIYGEVMDGIYESRI